MSAFGVVAACVCDICNDGVITGLFVLPRHGCVAELYRRDKLSVPFGMDIDVRRRKRVKRSSCETAFPANFYRGVRRPKTDPGLLILPAFFSVTISSATSRYGSGLEAWFLPAPTRSLCVRALVFPPITLTNRCCLQVWTSSPSSKISENGRGIRLYLRGWVRLDCWAVGGEMRVLVAACGEALPWSGDG